MRKLTLVDHRVRPQHRSGWGYALESLLPLTTDNGIVVDTFLEATFAWRMGEKIGRGILPYRYPWIGFLHNPTGIPEWHEYRSAPQVLLTQETWQSSMPACQGLITLSAHLAGWLRERVSVPVLALVHPTEPPVMSFSMERYAANPRKRLLQVGWWLRRFRSIYLTSLTNHIPTILEPLERSCSLEFELAIEREFRVFGRPRSGHVERITYLEDTDFDTLLSENVVLLDLYDSAANNTLVECIVRNTPVAVTMLPSTIEYLGDEYPLFIQSAEDISRKVENFDCIKAAHDYLSKLPKEPFSGTYFCNSLGQSDLYRDLHV